MMVEEAEVRRAASGQVRNGVCVVLAVGMLSACADNGTELTHAERSARAFNAKVTVHVPAQSQDAPTAPTSTTGALQRDKPQTTSRDSASTSNSSS